MTPDIAIIGSGPAGIATAIKLLEQGLKVTMIDVGTELPQNVQAQVSKMAQQEPSHWSNEDIEAFRYRSFERPLPLKRRFGTLMPYRTDNVETSRKSASFFGSFAKGGLSSVWGAAMLPYHSQDIETWPHEAQNLQTHYESVLRFVPQGSKTDDPLQKIFPLKSPLPSDMPFSDQAQRLFGNLKTNQVPLENGGIFFGPARVAVEFSSCRKCRMCLEGCPYDLIYSSEQTLATLQKSPHFRYLPHRKVNAFEEFDYHVRLETVNLKDRCIEQLEFDRVYIGAGVLGTTEIVLRSMGAYDKAIDLQSSHYFVLPLLTQQVSPNVTQENLHTLSQLFLEISDKSISQNLIHLQIYSHNHLLETAVKGRSKAKWVQSLGDRLLNRLILAQGFLHSSDSPGIFVTLEKKTEKLSLQVRKNPHTVNVVREAIRKLARNKSHLTFSPISFLSRTAPTGRSFHNGGTFPMATHPKPFQSDIFGRPTGYKRVHLVDSSVFPSVPATTITLPMMANATRIAAHYPHYSD